MMALCSSAGRARGGTLTADALAARHPRPCRGGLALAIAGGGTGGHLFPGIAVAQTLRSEDEASRVVFISVGNPFEQRTLARYGFGLARVAVEGLAGRGLWRQVRSAARLPAAVLAAMGILRRHRPDVVLGVGGYASGPVIVAAWLLGIPTAIHEQNCVPGMTNRWLMRIARRVLTSYPDTAGHLAPPRRRLTGNPVRPEFAAVADGPYQAPSPGQRLRLLVLGGSQGAHAINLALVSALPQLTGAVALEVMHQTGLQDEAWVSAAYRQHGIAATVQAFFDDMPARYRWCDLVLCRSGASTVFELAAVGRAAILVPYPFAAGDHQRLNANWLVSAGAAELVLERELTATRLVGCVAALAGDRPRLAAMAEAAAACARPRAAAEILAACRELARPGES